MLFEFDDETRPTPGFFMSCGQRGAAALIPPHHHERPA
jgi:hypothetical protein